MFGQHLSASLYSVFCVPPLQVVPWAAVGRTPRAHENLRSFLRETAHLEPKNPIFLPLRAGLGWGLNPPPPRFATPSRTYVPVALDRPSGTSD